MRTYMYWSSTDVCYTRTVMPERPAQHSFIVITEEYENEAKAPSTFEREKHVPLAALKSKSFFNGANSTAILSLSFISCRFRSRPGM